MKFVEWFPSVISLLALFVSIYSFNTTTNISKSTITTSRLVEYLKAYKELVKQEGGDAFTLTFYENPQKNRIKTQVEIVYSFLVATVDSMYENNDPRREIWIKYIPNIEGPFKHQNIEIWSSNKTVIAKVKAMRLDKYNNK